MSDGVAAGGCPFATICEVPLTASRVHDDAGTANNVNAWHGLLAGVTQAVTWMVALMFVTCAVEVAKPEPSVVAVLGESEAVPLETVNLMPTPACGTP